MRLPARFKRRAVSPPERSATADRMEVLDPSTGLFVPLPPAPAVSEAAADGRSGSEAGDATADDVISNGVGAADGSGNNAGPCGAVASCSLTQQTRLITDAHVESAEAESNTRALQGLPAPISCSAAAPIAVAMPMATEPSAVPCEPVDCQQHERMQDPGAVMTALPRDVVAPAPMPAESPPPATQALEAVPVQPEEPQRRQPRAIVASVRTSSQKRQAVAAAPTTSQSGRTVKPRVRD